MNFRRALGFVLCLALLGGLAPVAASEVAAKTLYRAAIDAGSSGTRLHLYKVVAGPYPTVKEIVVFENDDAEDGIDDFLDHVGGPNHNLGPDAVGDYVFKPLLDSTATALAAVGVATSEVTVDVLATAGMRRAEKPIGTHSHAEVRAYYELIRAYIAGRGFVAGQARTIDGDSEEGVWTWVDLNDHYRKPFTTATTPVGVVEVGGSSMQVSYPTDKRADPAKNVYAVTINGRSFNVFSRSYIGLGQDDARKSMRLAIPPDDGGASCFPTGMLPEQDAGDFIEVALVTITQTAQFRAHTCNGLYGNIVAERIAATGNPQVERSTGPFYGMAAVWHALVGIGVPPETPSREALAAIIAEKCAPAGAVANFNLASRHAQRLCSSASFMKALLYGPSGLFHKKPEMFAQAVADEKEKNGVTKTLVNWTRGYLLLKYAR